MPDSTSSVFNVQRRTVTRVRVPDAGGDCHINIKGSGAAWNNITSPDFLGFMEPGDDQERVQGKQSIEIGQGGRVDQIYGPLSTHISRHEVRDIQEGRETSVSGGSDSTRVKGDRVVIITGNDQRTVMGSAYKSILGGQLESEIANWWTSFGYLKLQSGGIDIKVCGANIGFQALKLDVSGMKTDFSAGKWELAAAKSRTIMAYIKLSGADIVLAPFKVISGGISNKVDIPGS